MNYTKSMSIDLLSSPDELYRALCLKVPYFGKKQS